MKNKRYIMILAIIIIAILAIVIFSLTKKDNNQSQNNNNTNEISITNEQKVNEQVNNEISNDIKNEVKTNEIENNIIENTTSTETIKDGTKTSEQKAVEIVKKDWGSTQNVDISIDGMDSKGNYIVAVRNSQTTEALAFYTVNVSNSTFSKREMN